MESFRSRQCRRRSRLHSKCCLRVVKPFSTHFSSLGSFFFLDEIPACPFFGKPFFGTRQYCIRTKTHRYIKLFYSCICLIMRPPPPCRGWGFKSSENYGRSLSKRCTVHDWCRDHGTSLHACNISLMNCTLQAAYRAWLLWAVGDGNEKMTSKYFDKATWAGFSREQLDFSKSTCLCEEKGHRRAEGSLLRPRIWSDAEGFKAGGRNVGKSPRHPTSKVDRCVSRLFPYGPQLKQNTGVFPGSNFFSVLKMITRSETSTNQSGSAMNRPGSAAQSGSEMNRSGSLRT